MSTFASLTRALVAAVLALGLAGCAGSFGIGQNRTEIETAIKGADQRVEAVAVSFGGDPDTEALATRTVVDLLAPDLVSAPDPADRASAIHRIIDDAFAAADFNSSWQYRFWTKGEWSARGEHGSLDAQKLFGAAFPGADRYVFNWNGFELDGPGDTGQFSETIPPQSTPGS